MSHSTLMVIVLVMFSLVGCSGKEKKPEKPAEPKKVEEVKKESAQMDVGGIESSASEIAKPEVAERTMEVAKAEPISTPSKAPTLEAVKQADQKDEFRCVHGNAEEKLKARKINGEGYGYYRKGLYKAAATAFKYAYSLDCDYFLAITNVASTYAKSEQYPDALAWLEVAYKVSPKRTIGKLQSDGDYKDFISQFLSDSSKAGDSLVAKDFLASNKNFRPSYDQRDAAKAASQQGASQEQPPVKADDGGSASKKFGGLLGAQKGETHKASDSDSEKKEEAHH